MVEEEIADGDAESKRTSYSNADASLSVKPPRVARRTLRAEVTFGILLGLYAVLAILAHYFAYFSWDLKTERAVQSIKAPGFQTFMILISALGSGWEPFGLVLMAGLALLMFRRRVEALVCVIGSASGSGVDTLLKELSGRPRPSEDLVQVLRHYTRESFPSGHVFFYVEFFGFLFFLAYVLLKRGPLRSAVLVIFGILISVVGLSRVYLGAHWPSDVVGAYLAGGIWLMLMIEVYRRIQVRRQSD